MDNVSVSGAVFIACEIVQIVSNSEEWISPSVVISSAVTEIVCNKDGPLNAYWKQGDL